MEHKIINTGDYLLIVDESKKIIAHLPLNNSPILEGVDLLPNFSKEEDVEKKSYDFIKDIEGNGAQRLAFIDGYLEAKEKYKFTEEDLRKAIEVGVNAETGDYPKGFSHKLGISLEDYFIQSLQQPKMPVGFECEMEETPSWSGIWKKVTTTNSQGLIQWVGEYIYD